MCKYGELISRQFDRSKKIAPGKWPSRYKSFADLPSAVPCGTSTEQSIMQTFYLSSFRSLRDNGLIKV